jgi:transketolase
MTKFESIREAYGLELVKMAEQFKDLVVLDADVSKSTRTLHFGKIYPERFFNFGIAEQNMMAAAAGMATIGDIPVVNSFSFLVTYRAADQFRTSIVYPKLNVKIGASYGGLSDSYDGPTHQTVADIAWVRALPHLTVIVPSDAVEIRKALPEMLVYNGPVWFRLCRAETEVYHHESYTFKIGKAELVRDGNDLTMVGCGIVLPRLLKVADELHGKGIEAQVLNIPTLKPLDEEMIRNCALKTGIVLTVEEHSIIGGLGSTVTELFSMDNRMSVKRLGIPDCFAESGPYEALLDRYGLAVKTIVETAEKMIRKRSL